nr:carbohydrate ABC transporter permease [uncultured Schaedlerella sp.]
MNGLKKRMIKGCLSFITILAAALFLSPIYIVVVNAFKTPLETAESILSFPAALHLENFSKAIEVTNFWVSLKNSMIVTVSSVVLIVLCASMAGYVICRNNRKRFYRGMDILLMSGMMVSFQFIMIPAYRMLKNLKLLNTYAGAVIFMVGTSVSYATFLYAGFVKTLPVTLEEAAMIDGCGPFQTFWIIVFPLMKPITATVTALEMLWMWNEFNIALIVLQKKEMRTIPMQQFYFFGQHISNMNQAFAAAAISLIPVVIFFFLTQKSIAGGITAGSVKG